MLGKTNCITSLNSGEIKYEIGSKYADYYLTIPNPAGSTGEIVSVFVTGGDTSYGNIYRTIYGDFISNNVLALTYVNGRIGYANYNISNISITNTNININSPGGITFNGSYTYTILYKQ